jgi:hypothetical protein
LDVAAILCQFRTSFSMNSVMAQSHSPAKPHPLQKTQGTDSVCPCAIMPLTRLLSAASPRELN